MQQFNHSIKITKIFFDGKKVVIMTSPKLIRFDISTEVNKSLEHEIRFITNRNESLAECAIKNEISQLLFKYKHEQDKQ